MKGNKPKILLVEGLFSYGWLKYLQEGLMPHLLKREYPVEIRPWTDDDPTDADWIIGHSLGAGVALDIARKTHGNLKVITLDPRVKGKPFKKPGNVEFGVNFYRPGFLRWMKGYKIDGFKNVPMGRPVGHGELCENKYIRDYILSLLANQNRFHKQ